MACLGTYSFNYIRTLTEVRRMLTREVDDLSDTLQNVRDGGGDGRNRGRVAHTFVGTWAPPPPPHGLRLGSCAPRPLPYPLRAPRFGLPPPPTHHPSLASP